MTTSAGFDIAAADPVFHDRADAGRWLAQSLAHHAGLDDVVVLGLARGGVPVAREVAVSLGAPLGVLAARRIGVPGIEEVTLGAIAEGDPGFVANAISRYIGVPAALVERLTAGERVDLERRAALYRAGQPLPDLEGRTVLLVDDGLETGATLRAAARAVRRARPRQLVAAVPVGSRWGANEVRAEVDELLVLVTPSTFEVVARSYASYPAVSDDDVLALLGRLNRRASPMVVDITERLGRAFRSANAQAFDRERTIAIPIADGAVAGDLGVPPHATIPSEARRSHGVRGLAVLAHADGSSRHNYRTRYLAGRLRLAGYATLRVDLFTSAEHGIAGDAVLELDIERVATRLTSVCDWAADVGIAGAHRTILVGAGTGGAVALVAAARRPDWIWSVIVRGSRVDRAADALAYVRAPVLLIAGAADRETLASNGAALRMLPRGAQLVTVPHAGAGFDEPGVLGVVGEQATRWLDRLESRPPTRPSRECA